MAEDTGVGKDSIEFHPGQKHVGYWTVGERRLWSLVMFLGLVVLSATRMSLPVTIVDISQDLAWDKQTCGIVLSSFYWGYLLTQVVGGWMSDQHGGERVLWVAGFIWSLVDIFTPYIAHVSTVLVISARIVVGLSQGVHYPALLCLLTHRVHARERSFYYGLISTGASLGTVALGSLGSLFLSSHEWPLVFVLLGVCGIAWALLLRSVSHSNHTESKSGHSVPRSYTSVPWRKILSSPAVLAAFLVHFCDNVFLHNLMSWAPTYFHDSFPDIQGSAWIYNSLPWLAVALGSLGGGWAVRWMTTSRGMSMTVARKAIVAVNLGGQGLFLFIMALLEHREMGFTTAIALIVLACCCHGLMVVGPTMNLTDLTPDHVGAVFGLTNTFGALPGAFGVSLTGYILHSTSSWSTVFCLMAGINVPGLVVYLLFGSAKKLQLNNGDVHQA